MASGKTADCQPGDEEPGGRAVLRDRMGERPEAGKKPRVLEEPREAPGGWKVGVSGQRMAWEGP